MKKTGFYIIKDKFFEDMPDPYLKGNKAGNRPHYYCFEDTNTGIYWMIPLSSRIDKYRRIMEEKEKAGKLCDILHIVKLDDSRESAFLLPVTLSVVDFRLWHFHQQLDYGCEKCYCFKYGNKLRISSANLPSS